MGVAYTHSQLNTYTSLGLAHHQLTAAPWTQEALEPCASWSLGFNGMGAFRVPSIPASPWLWGLHRFCPAPAPPRPTPFSQSAPSEVREEGQAGYGGQR